MRVLAVLLCLLATPALAIHVNSTTQETTELQMVGQFEVSTTIITQLFTVPTGTHQVMLQGDGNLTPIGAARAVVFMSVDATAVGNRSVIDWRNSPNPQMRGVNVLALVTLSGGQHEARLVLEHGRGESPVGVAVGATLSVVIDPALYAYGSRSLLPEPGNRITAASYSTYCVDLGSHGGTTSSPLVARDSAEWFDFENNRPAAPPTPTAFEACSILEVPMAAGGQTIALSSASAYRPNSGPESGEAATILAVEKDIRFDSPRENWAVSDLCLCTSAEAPLSNQWISTAAVPAGQSMHLMVSDVRWSSMSSQNDVLYRTRPYSTLVALQGPFPVLGHAAASSAPAPSGQMDYRCEAWTADPGWMTSFPGEAFRDVEDTRSAQYCLDLQAGLIDASATASCPSGYTAPGQPQGRDLATGTITIPSGHSGYVMIEAKTSVVGHACDHGGTARMWIKVDGQKLGSVAEQGLAYPEHQNGGSSRQLTAHALARGLTAGAHTVSLWVEGEPTAAEACFGADIDHPGTFVALQFDGAGNLMWWG